MSIAEHNLQLEIDEIKEFLDYHAQQKTNFSLSEEERSRLSNAKTIVLEEGSYKFRIGITSQGRPYIENTRVMVIGELENYKQQRVWLDLNILKYNVGEES